MSQHKARHFYMVHTPASPRTSQATVEDCHESMGAVFANADGRLRVENIRLAWEGGMRIVIQRAIFHQLGTTPDRLKQVSIRSNLHMNADAVAAMKCSCKPVACIAAPHKGILLGR